MKLCCKRHTEIARWFARENVLCIYVFTPTVTVLFLGHFMAGDHEIKIGLLSAMLFLKATFPLISGHVQI